MAEVAVVTDSVADVPPHLVEKFGITVVPLNLAFGSETYFDGVDITPDQFYEKLKTTTVMPTTSTPSPSSFTEVYDSLAERSDGIVFIGISTSLSATCASALEGIKLMKKQCRVEVVDSGWAITPEGLIAVAAAEAARNGAGVDEVLEAAERAKSRVDMLAAFDTLEYLERGGRIGKAQALLGSLLKINPVIYLKDGIVHPVARERSREKALDRLCCFPDEYEKLEALAVEYAIDRDEAETLVQRLRSRYPGVPVHVTRASPVIGTHTGPGLIVVSAIGDKKR
jgi:DegV family protein with EDD domain